MTGPGTNGTGTNGTGTNGTGIESGIELDVDTFGDVTADGAGALPHATMVRSIELFGTEVAPQLRELLGHRAPADTA